MENKSIFSRMDSTILDFVNEVTQPFQNQHDLEMFCDILSGRRFKDNNVCFKLRIGSNRRLNYKMLDDNMPALPYNEFKIQIRISSQSFHLMATIFHNDNNTTEGLSYTLDSNINSGVPEETWVLPNEDTIDNQKEIDGRKPDLFFAEICQLHKLNRDMKIISELEPTEEVLEIQKRFDELMLSAADEDINWALSNELETEEKIRVLQNLSPDRKLQIIQNLTNEKIN